MATRKARLALLAAATVGTAAIAGAVVVEDRWDRPQADAVAVKDGWDRPPLAEPLERRAGYREHKRACLDPRDDRREARARSCRAWQEMLAEERQRLALEEAVPAYPAASAPEPR
jgi:hypothetical protein